MTDSGNISKEPYKGVRDFFPRDMFMQRVMFAVWQDTAGSFGYNEYSASILEPHELYKAKTGEEIVDEQAYTFVDRGDREVTLRPEMTPTLARMIATRHKEMAMPVRWYSVPNIFRYERPQRGRLREHWQLNADIFGISDITAEAEIILLASAVLYNFGAEPTDFQIRINHRGIIEGLCSDVLGLEQQTQHQLFKLIDRKEKISEEDFGKAAREIVDNTEELDAFLAAETLDDVVAVAETAFKDNPGVTALRRLLAMLEELEVKNVVFDPTIVRGLDYYTGVVFEIFDTAEENSRAIAGGGRYDELLSIFDTEPIPAVGFGMGDVTLYDFLQTHGLIPDYISPTDLSICLVDTQFTNDAFRLAGKLRTEGLNVAVDISGKGVGTQIKNADNNEVPYVLCLGENEIKSDQFTIKHLGSGEETTVSADEITDSILGLSE